MARDELVLESMCCKDCVQVWDVVACHGMNRALWIRYRREPNAVDPAAHHLN